MYVHNSVVEFFGGIPKLIVLCNFLRKLMVTDKKIFTGLLELIQLYKGNPIENFFIFTSIYQNYTLALTLIVGVKSDCKLFINNQPVLSSTGTEGIIMIIKNAMLSDIL